MLKICSDLSFWKPHQDFDSKYQKITEVQFLALLGLVSFLSSLTKNSIISKTKRKYSIIYIGENGWYYGSDNNFNRAVLTNEIIIIMIILYIYYYAFSLEFFRTNITESPLKNNLLINLPLFL
jgi:uncharacterized membrane protein